MNRLRISKLLDEYYDHPEHERDWAMIDLLEALLEPGYDPNLGKTDESIDESNET
jgi:hypothetical protein